MIHSDSVSMAFDSFKHLSAKRFISMALFEGLVLNKADKIQTFKINIYEVAKYLSQVLAENFANAE